MSIIVAIYEAGLSQSVYYGFFCLGFLATYIFLFWYGKRLCLKFSKVLLSGALASGGVLLVMALMQKVLSPIATMIPIMNSYLNNMGRGFVFVPLIAWLVSAIIKVDWKRLCSLYAFSQTITWGFASLGCLFAECCKGYPFTWGLPHPRTKELLFPTQIINGVGLLSIAVYILCRCRKKQYIPDGREYPIMLIMVGILRFSTEFLMDNPKIMLGLSSLSFDAIAMCIVGSTMLMTMRKAKSKSNKEAPNAPLYIK